MKIEDDFLNLTLKHIIQNSNVSKKMIRSINLPFAQRSSISRQISLELSLLRLIEFDEIIYDKFESQNDRQMILWSMYKCISKKECNNIIQRIFLQKKKISLISCSLFELKILIQQLQKYTDNVKCSQQDIQIIGLLCPILNSNKVNPYPVYIQFNPSTIHQYLQLLSSSKSIPQYCYIFYYFFLSINKYGIQLDQSIIHHQIGSLFQACFAYMHLQTMQNRWNNILHQFELFSFKYNHAPITVIKYKAFLEPLIQLNQQQHIIYADNIKKLSQKQLKIGLFWQPTKYSRQILKLFVSQSLKKTNFTDHWCIDPLYSILIKKDLLFKYAGIIQICVDISLRHITQIIRQKPCKTLVKNQYMLNLSLGLIGFFQKLQPPKLNFLLQENHQLREAAQALGLIAQSHNIE